MLIRTTRVLFLHAALVIAASQAMAQTTRPSGSTSTPPSRQQADPDAEQDPDADDAVDVGDLIRRLRGKDHPPSGEAASDERGPMRAFAPVIGVKPSSGVIVGVAGNVGFFRGDPATTHISSSVASMTFTSKKQAGISAHTTMFGRDDRWLLELDDRFQWTSQETFGLGTSPRRRPAKWSASISTACTNRRITACARTSSPAAASTSTVMRTSSPRKAREDGWPQSP